MKKIFSLLLVIFVILTLTSCSSNSSNINQKIVAPKINNIPIEGKWKIVNVLNNNELKSHVNTNWVGKYAEFSIKYVTVGDFSLYDPNFEIRRLNADEYLLFNHKSFGNKIKMPSKETDVITITGKDKFLCEILKVDNRRS